MYFKKWLANNEVIVTFQLQVILPYIAVEEG